MIYEAGATEVHLGIACPPITIRFLWNRYTKFRRTYCGKESIEEINKEIGSTSLFFLS